MLGFLEVLCGSKASDLNVKDKEKYNFDPKKLLSQIAVIVLRVWTQECRQSEAVSPTEGFLVSFSTHPDFTQSVVDCWTNVLTRHSLLDPPSQRNFSTFLEEVMITHVDLVPHSTLPFLLIIFRISCLTKSN